MKRSFILILIILIFVNFSYAQDFWEQTNGPYGGHIRSLAINSSGHIFSGTEYGGVYRSTDNGDNWIQINTGLGNISIIKSNFGLTLILGTSIEEPATENVTINTYNFIPKGLPSTKEMIENTYQVINISVSENLDNSIESVKMIIPIPKSWLANTDTKSDNILFKFYLFAMILFLSLQP